MESPAQTNMSPKGGPSEKAGKGAPGRDEGVSVSAMIGTVSTRATLDAANSSVRFEASRAKMADLARFLMSFGVSDGRGERSPNRPGRERTP